MPAYGIASNLPKFQPFSFERYVQPLQMYGQAYKEQEAALETLSAKAMQWEKLANNAADKEQYEQYKAYADSLRMQADDLASNGLSIGSRRALMDLKARYSSEITPIEEAYNTRLEDIKTQRNAYINSKGKLRFTKNASEVGLGDYIKGSVPQYGIADIDDVYTKATQMAAAMSKRHVADNSIHRLNDQYLQTVQATGYDEDAAAEILKGNSPEFNEMINTIEQSIGIDSFGAVDQKALRAAIMNGIGTGLDYTVSRSPLEDKNYQSDKDKIMLEATLRGEGYYKDANGKYQYNETKHLRDLTNKSIASAAGTIAAASAKSKGKGSGNSSGSYTSGMAFIIRKDGNTVEPLDYDKNSQTYDDLDDDFRVVKAGEALPTLPAGISEKTHLIFINEDGDIAVMPKGTKTNSEEAGEIDVSNMLGDEDNP